MKTTLKDLNCSKNHTFYSNNSFIQSFIENKKSIKEINSQEKVEFFSQTARKIPITSTHQELRNQNYFKSTSFNSINLNKSVQEDKKEEMPLMSHVYSPKKKKTSVSFTYNKK